MEHDRTIKVRWLMFDVPQLVTICMCLMSVAGLYYALDKRITTVETSRQERSIVADRRFNAIENQLIIMNSKTDRLPQLEQRVGQTESQLAEINRRFDRFTELLTNNIELIRKDVGTLTTKVEVNSVLTSTLADKLDKLLETKKANLQTEFDPKRLN